MGQELWEEFRACQLAACKSEFTPPFLAQAQHSSSEQAWLLQLGGTEVPSPHIGASLSRVGCRLSGSCSGHQMLLGLHLSQCCLPVSLLIPCLFLGHVVVDFPLLSVILATYHWVVPPAKALLVIWILTG